MIGRFAPVLVLLGGVVLGVVTDAENWPVDNWLVVETVYVLAVLIGVGSVDDFRRWRNYRDRRP